MTASTKVRAAAAVRSGVFAFASPSSAKTPSSVVKCGDTVTRSVKLTTDLIDCPGNGLTIGASGITVNLNGHTIDGTVTQLTVCNEPPFGVNGIENGGGYDDLTVKDGTLQQFFNGFSAGSETAGMSNSNGTG